MPIHAVNNDAHLGQSCPKGNQVTKVVKIGQKHYLLSICQAAKYYIERGVFPVPIDAGKKGPHLGAWPQFTCGSDEVKKHFDNNDSIGILLGPSGLVDIDFDCDEAIPFAPLFPKTCAIARNGKSVSHLLYRTTGSVQFEQFHDPQGVLLLEVRVGARCVLAPPSKHPNGEQLYWVGDDEDPAVADAKNIVKGAKQTAAFALIARNWPSAESHMRHKAALALGGIFYRSGVEEQTAVTAVKLIAQVAGDEEPSDRIAAVKDTYKNAESGEPFTGFPVFKDVFGEEIAKLVASWLDYFEEGPEAQKTSLPLKNFVLTLDQLVKSVQPPIEYIIDSWLPVPSIAMVYAFRGVGKSLFVMELGFSVAIGKPLFDCWDVAQPRRVLLIDGEMPIGMLQHRAKAIWKGSEQLPNNFRILPSDLLWAANDALNIADTSTQQRIDQMLLDMDADGWRPELIIFDNLSSLTWGIDENSNSEQDSVNRWLISLRSRGYAVLTVHHSTKDGKTQRGASRREDILDTSIRLDPEDGPDTSFTIRFAKLRGERPKPSTLTVTMHKSEEGSFEWSTDEPTLPKYMHALKFIYLHKPKSQSALAKLMNICHTMAGKHVKTLVSMGLATKTPLGLTKGGVAKYEDIFLINGIDPETDL